MALVSTAGCQAGSACQLPTSRQTSSAGAVILVWTVTLVMIFLPFEPIVSAGIPRAHVNAIIHCDRAPITRLAP
jgi:hypothetical protein